MARTSRPKTKTAARKTAATARTKPTKTAAAKSKGAAAPADDGATAIAALGAAFARVLASCLEWSGDGRLAADQKQTFFALATLALFEVERLRRGWDTMPTDPAATSARIAAARGAVDEAIAGFDAMKSVVSTKRVAHATIAATDAVVAVRAFVDALAPVDD